MWSGGVGDRTTQATAVKTLSPAPGEDELNLIMVINSESKIGNPLTE